MEAKQKFETIIQKIENLILEDAYIQDKEVSKMAFELVNEIIDERSRNNIFKFLMDKTVIQYISERRMMISYKKLLSNGDIHKTYQKAIDISGTGTAQAFSTKFKKMFGISPKEAFEINDASKYKSRPSWDNLTENGVDMKMENSEIIVETFDRPNKNYERDLKEFYEFDDEEYCLVSNLWLDGKALKRQYFQYVADYFYKKESTDRYNRAKADLEDKTVQYLYFEKELNFDQIFRILLLQYLGFIKRPIDEYDEDYLNICSEYKVYTVDELETLEKKINYYKKMRNETYTKYDAQLYGFYVSRMGSAEKAFRIINPGIVNEKKLEKYKNRFGDENEANDCQDIVVEEYMEYENEFTDRDEDYAAYDVDEFDEDGWIVNELERDVYDDNEIYAYEEAYEEELERYMEFEKACEEESSLSQEEIDMMKIARRPFKEYSDLDVQGYWEKRCNTKVELSDLDINIDDIDCLYPKDMMNGIDDLLGE